MNRILTILVCSAAAVMMAALAGLSQQPDRPARPDDAAMGRARKMVHMLDDIYKQTIVLITDKYVHAEDDYPAGAAAVTLFGNISKAGWHQVRLMDASGEPNDSENVARDAFEKEAIQKLKKGSDYVEQLVFQDGRYQLRAVTPVPVVMEKCVMCHSHYADARPGEPIGAISYTVPIE